MYTTPGTEPENAETAFLIKDCALIAIATGRRIYTPKELRDNLLNVDGDSIYYHFWGGLLQPRLEEREYANDFAAWARHGLHDNRLAERLAVIDPTLLGDIETVRQQLVEVVEDRLEETEYLQWMRATQPFEFLRSKIVVFDTHHRVNNPRELAALVPHLSTSSLFYHFIDARRRLPGKEDDFRLWLSGFSGCTEVCDQLADIDPFFGPLTELRRQLSGIFDALLAGER